MINLLELIGIIAVGGLIIAIFFVLSFFTLSVLVDLLKGYFND